MWEDSTTNTKNLSGKKTIISYFSHVQGKPSQEKISFCLEKVQRGGGDHVPIQTFRGTFCCCLCLDIFDEGGVSPKSKILKELLNRPVVAGAVL